MNASHARYRWLAAGAVVVALGLLTFFTLGTFTPATGATERSESQIRELLTQTAVLSELPGNKAIDTAPPSAAVQSVPSGQDRESIEALASLSIRVKNGSNPLSGVTVFAYEEGDSTDEAPHARTDRRGRTRLRVPANTTVTVAVELPGAAEPIRQTFMTPGPAETKVVVIDASLHASDLSVRVQLVSFPTGAPLADCKVTGKPREGSRKARSQTRTTDMNGLVTLPWFPLGTYEAEAPRHGSFSVASPQRGSDAPLVLRLPADAMIFGRLALPEGSSDHRSRLHVDASRDRAIPKLSFTSTTQGTLSPPSLEDVPLKPATGWRRVSLGFGYARVDQQGHWHVARIRFNDLSAVDDVSVRAYLNDQWRTVATELTVAPGDRLEVEDLCEGASDVALQLHYDRGYAWSRSFKVTLFRVGNEQSSVFVRARCGASGVVKVPHLPVGTWDLCLGSPSAPGPDNRLTTFDHTSAPTRDITLTGWVPLRGTLEPPTGDDPKGNQVVTLQRDSQFDYDNVAKDGTFDLSPARMDEEHAIALESGFRAVVAASLLQGIGYSDDQTGTITIGKERNREPGDSVTANYFITGEDIVLKRRP